MPVRFDVTEPKFKIGDVVTLKTHPLAFQEDGLIDAYINQIPPFMCVKEIHVEHRKHLFSHESNNYQVADDIKYLCVYFNQHRMIFEEKFLYQSMMIPLSEVTFHREDETPTSGHQDLRDETYSYKAAEYKFGELVFFKTYKLEKRKKFRRLVKSEDSPEGMEVKAIKTSMTHTSPAFVISGYKENDQRTSYDKKSGKLRRQCSRELYKIKWYNAYQEKFSEEYIPKELLTGDEKIYKNDPVVQVPLENKIVKQ